MKVKATDWVKWGSIAGIAAVLAALTGVYVAHKDQRDKVYVTVTPVGWKIDSSAMGREHPFATVIYNITVTGRSPAMKDYLRERCVSPIPVGETIRPQSGRQYLGELPPGTTERRCGVLGQSSDMEDVRYVGIIDYEDELGRHSVPICFEGEGPAEFVAEGKQYADLNPCDYPNN